jgi:hypothetical protein
MISATENWKDKRVHRDGRGWIYWQRAGRGSSIGGVVRKWRLRIFRGSAKKVPTSPDCATPKCRSSGFARRGSRPGSLGKPDYIFHLGACSSTTETNEKYLRENNYEYSRTLAEWALRAGVRFVYASSAATYGDGSAGMDDSDPQQLERLRPLNLYGQSKQWMDLHAWREGWLDRIVGLKYFNVFGPNENHKGDMRSLVCKSYAEVLKTGVIRFSKAIGRNTGMGSSGAIFFT